MSEHSIGFGNMLLETLQEEIKKKDAEIERLRLMVAEDIGTWQDLWRSEREANERLRAACEQMLIGGNHIALYKTEKWPEPGTDPMTALETIGAGQSYDMWCCWNAMMCGRRALDCHKAACPGCESAPRAVMCEADGQPCYWPECLAHGCMEIGAHREHARGGK